MHQCNPVPPMLTCSSMWIQKGSAVMLAIKRSTGITPEVNLRNPLLAGDEVHKWTHPGDETRRRHHQKSKTGVPVAPQERLMTCTIFWKKCNTFQPSESLTKRTSYTQQDKCFGNCWTILINHQSSCVNSSLVHQLNTNYHITRNVFPEEFFFLNANNIYKSV